ncbi:MAG: glycosyltransferase family 1 protein [Candidatus Sericytochromatia bacterium]
MRVGIDTVFYSNSPTGIGKYTYELCYHLKKYNELELVLFVNIESPLLSDEYFKDNEKIIVKYSKNDIRRLWYLGNLVDKSNLDLFHVPSYNIPFIRETKYIVSIHDLIHIKFSDIYGIPYRIYYETIVKKGLLNAEKIITISENSKKDLKSWLGNYNEDKIYITPLASNKNFSPHLGIIDLFYNLNIDKNHFILYVGNNRPNKNLKRLLISYSKVLEKNPDFPEMILTCNSNNELDELIENLFIKDKVFFIEGITEDELIILYSYALFLVFPSLYEGFGLPLVEAMSTGCPIMCSRLSSIPEVVQDNCLYFDPYEIRDISEALEKMYYDEELRFKISKQGLERAKDFSWDKTAYETYKIYNSCI